ncbi:MAG: T9SS type B sorting domain-containing protein [Flavobacteriaceae bacterium]
MAQDCPDLLNPLQGATNVPVDTSISWETVVGVTGYIISLGTTPGGSEIVNDQPVGNDPNFTPPLGLPESSTIYVTITLFFFDQDDIVCASQSFTTENVVTVPECTQLLNPENGATGVNVATNLRWGYAPRATGYRITIGTLPGAGDIANQLDVGNVLSYDPISNFPPDTEIYVLLQPYNENGLALSCPEEYFVTASLGNPPGCTYLITPENGAINVSLSPFLEWAPVPDALGYIVFIGRTPFINDVLDGAIFTTTSTYVLNFESNNTYYVRIIPFNEAGQAVSCEQESFSTILGCGPFYDPDTGELISFYPESSFPEVVGICENSLPTVIQSPDVGNGYRWFQLFNNGDELLLSEESTVEISETGMYRYEVYNLIEDAGSSIECTFSQDFEVVASSVATIEAVNIAEVNLLFEFTVAVSGIGEYEFSLDGVTYQDEPFFEGLPAGQYVLYVRDKKGCGVVERPVKLAYPPTGFPPYFSPNGDGINDYWQYVKPILDPLPLTNIYIYDRYGKILANFSPDSEGWNGRYNNNPMPAGGYWYKALTVDGEVFIGHFSLVR